MPLLKQNLKQKSSPFLKGALFLGFSFFVLGCGDWALNGSKERTPIETPLLEKQARLAEELEKVSYDEPLSTDSSADFPYSPPPSAQNSDPEAKSEGVGEQAESVQGQGGDQLESDCDCNTKKESDINTNTDINTDSISPSNDQSIDSSSLDQVATESPSASGANQEQVGDSLISFTDCSSVNINDCVNIKNGTKVCALVRETKGQEISDVWLEFENYCSACSTSSTKIGQNTLEVIGFKLGACPEEKELASE